jgi:hypothetical protein
LTDASAYTKEEIAELYHRRWLVEPALATCLSLRYHSDW